MRPGAVRRYGPSLLAVGQRGRRTPGQAGGRDHRSWRVGQKGTNLTAAVRTCGPSLLGSGKGNRPARGQPKLPTVAVGHRSHAGGAAGGRRAMAARKPSRAAARHEHAPGVLGISGRVGADEVRGCGFGADQAWSLQALRGRRMTRSAGRPHLRSAIARGTGTAMTRTSSGMWPCTARSAPRRALRARATRSCSGLPPPKEGGPFGTGITILGGHDDAACKACDNVGCAPASARVAGCAVGDAPAVSVGLAEGSPPKTGRRNLRPKGSVREQWPALGWRRAPAGFAAGGASAIVRLDRVMV
jgi:hypothetical protein